VNPGQLVILAVAAAPLAAFVALLIACCHSAFSGRWQAFAEDRSVRRVLRQERARQQGLVAHRARN
jgi:hypothetical protein